nr:IS30 family transposase [Leucobacter insecticola]
MDPGNGGRTSQNRFPRRPPNVGLPRNDLPLRLRTQEPGSQTRRVPPRGHKKRRKHHGRKVHSSKIPNRVSIHHRPPEVNERATFGDWEGDSVVGVRSVGGGVHTEVERQTRMMFATKVDTLTSRDGVDAQKRIFASLPPGARRSTTMDNGTEMHLHTELVTELGMKTYFADPYSSWQRGTNEHHNGRLRRTYPKGTDFSQVSEEELQSVIAEINNQPRKNLAWLTPYEAFQEQLDSLRTGQCCTSE